MAEAQTLTCPKCGSTRLSKQPQGFDRKKAIIGAGATGGPGIIWGRAGRNKIVVTCLDCGHQFRVRKM